MASFKDEDDNGNHTSTNTTTNTTNITNNKNSNNNSNKNDNSINVNNITNNNNNNNNNNINKCYNNNVNSSSSNNNNNNDNDNSSTKNSQNFDENEIKIKKLTLHQRKQELEKLLSEKSWFLQQIQKQENQILNGNYEYLNLNEIFANLAQQYKQEPSAILMVGSGVGGHSSNNTAILRRKISSKENQNINNNNQSNRQSEISNRSSEYDNFPSSGSGNGRVCEIGEDISGSIASGEIDGDEGGGVGSGSGNGNSSVSGSTQGVSTKNPLKKRATLTPLANINCMQLQRQQQQQQQQQPHQPHHHQKQQMLHQHMLQQQQQQQQQHHQKLLQHHTHYHPNHYHQLQQQHSVQSLHQQQQQQQQHQQQQRLLFSSHNTDAISLYSVNSANVATLRQQHVAPQQQPIIVQCDKYYLSPTQQSYNDGCFIKSSQNIKKYVSPMSSPTTHHHYHHHHHTNQNASNLNVGNYEIQTQQQQLQHHQEQQLQQSSQQQQQTVLSPLKQLSPIHVLHYHHHQHQQQQPQHQLDVISLTPSYINSIETDSTHNLRWRSQTNIPHSSTMQQSPRSQDVKSNSSDMLSQIIPNASSAVSNLNLAVPGSMNFYPIIHQPSSNLNKTKLLDEISISSLNSETAKKSKSKQWLESSLDGPALIRTSQSSTNDTVLLPLQRAHTSSGRERSKLSSQSMSSGRHYSLSSQKHSHNTKLLQDDDGCYAKLSQSTSYLNSMETNNGIALMSSYQYSDSVTTVDIPIASASSLFKYLPPKPMTITSNSTSITMLAPPPLRPPPTISTDKPPPVTPTPSTASALSPDIRIESPKNMTIVQQATFQPYKEVTKPFEMSDFYKYSIKYRQKEVSSASISAAANIMPNISTEPNPN